MWPNIRKSKHQKRNFSRDGLSPVLFVLCMISLRRLKAAYEWGGHGFKTTYLLFMYVHKIFGKSNGQLGSLVQTVHISSKHIGIEFGIKKCGILVLKKTKVVNSDGIELPNGKVTKDIEKNGYKYKRVLEADILQERAMEGYKRRLKLILK